MKPTESNTVNLITKKLDDACFIDFGTRVVQKKDGGNIYPVFGGGGATFKMDTYNRESCLVVSRFAMSKQCTRFVEGKFYLNDSGLTVRPKNKKELTQEYLDYLLLTLNDTIYSLSRGTAQRNLNVSKFRNLIINYPDSIELQLHIANLLSKAENLIAQRKESIRLLDEFLKSTFLEMFGDPVRNEKKLPLKNLEDIAAKEKNAIVDGPFGSSLKPEDYLDDGIPIIRINNIRDEGFYNNEFKFISQEKYNELIRSKVQPNDILIARVGNTIGKTCIFNQNFTALLSTTGVAKLTIDSSIVNLKFLHQQLRLPQYVKYIWNQVQGAGQPYLNLSKIKGFKIIYPPLELQTQFAHIVEKTEALKTQYQTSLTELENLYCSLSQKAFKGELTIQKNHVNP